MTVDDVNDANYCVIAVVTAAWSVGGHQCRLLSFRLRDFATRLA